MTCMEGTEARGCSCSLSESEQPCPRAEKSACCKPGGSLCGKSMIHRAQGGVRSMLSTALLLSRAHVGRDVQCPGLYVNDSLASAAAAQGWQSWATSRTVTSFKT